VRFRVALAVLSLLAIVAGCALVAVPLGLVVGGAAGVAVSLLWPYSEGGEQR
jgi:hypothetical protein